MYYDKDSPNFASELAKDPRILLSNYSHYVEETPKDGTLSDINHIYALSSVLNAPIRWYFPSNNPNNNPFQKLIVGRDVTHNKTEETIKIMWTATQLPSPLKIENLIIDTFVPLIEKNDLKRVARSLFLPLIRNSMISLFNSTIIWLSFYAFKMISHINFLALFYYRIDERSMY